MNSKFMTYKLGWFSLILLLAGWGCTSSESKDEMSDAADNEAKVKTVDVNTQEFVPQKFNSYVRLVGSVEAGNDVRLSAEVNGQILRYYVEKGDRVEEGDPIAKIDDKQLKTEQKRLEAATQQALEQYERQKRLWQEDSIGSEISFLNAKYAYQQMKANLENVEVSLNKTLVKAPFNAVIEDKITEKGEIVAPGTPLVRLIASDYVKVDAGVPSRYSDVVNVGDTARIWLDTNQPDTISVPITFVGQSIDRMSRTFNIELGIPRSMPGLKIGMIANVKLRTQMLENVLVINQAYLYQKENHYVVYVTGNNGNGDKIALSRDVETGPSYGNYIVLEEGVQPGESLITVGSSFVEDSMRINIVERTTRDLAELY